MSYIGLAPGVSSQRMEDTFTATAGQTSFVPSSGYIPGNIDVYRNGVKLVNGLEFTASNGIGVVLNNACAAGDSVVLLSYIPRGLSDGYLKSEADSRFIRNDLSAGIVYSGGNVGLGWATPTDKLHLGSGSAANLVQRYYQAGVIEYWMGTLSGEAKFHIGTGAGYSGKLLTLWGSALGVLRDAPAYPLDVYNTSNGQTVARFMGKYATNGTVALATFARDGGAIEGAIRYNDPTGTIQFGTTTDHTFSLITNGAERARMTNSGTFFLGGTGTGSNVRFGVLFAGAGTQYGMELRPAADNTVAINFLNASGSGVGAVAITGSSTSFNTSSDYRLKELVTPMTGALAKNELLNPVTFKWKADGSDGQGFIAHELQAVFPDAVTGEKDAVDDDGNPRYQGIDTSFLVGHLVACIKELNAEVTALRADITALQGALNG